LTAKVSIKAIVVGTGFGGAVVACRLSQAGLAPLVIERGRRYESGDFPALPAEDGLLPDGRRLAWGPEQGFVDVQDLGEILSVQAAGYGGGSLVYANVHLRARAEIFTQELSPHKRVWPAAYTRDALDPYYDLVASMLDVAPITEHADGARLVKTDQLKRAARALGREAECFHPPLAVSRKDGVNQHGKPQAACKQCGSCCMGCPHGAKNTLDHNYLALAEAHGAVVRTQCEVLEIKRRDGRYLVCYVDHLRGSKALVETDYLFLCAGSIHSTRLLATAELGLSASQRAALRLGYGYFPNADAFGVVFDTEHAQHPSWGPTITTATVFRDREAGEKRRDEARSWFMVQDGGYARELERMIGLLRSPLFAGRNRFPVPAPEASAPAQVAASEYEPPARELEARAPALRSPLDGVLDAWSDGTLGRALPAQLARALPAIRDSISQVLLPVLVEDTIERGIKRNFAWFFRCFSPESAIGRRFLASCKRIAACFGSSAEMARDAQDALEELGGLSRHEAAERLLGYDARNADHRLMLLTMGPDRTSGVLHEKDGRLVADLDLYHLAPRYLDEELAMRDVARVLGGELRVNPAWSFLGKPVTVHSQGGCRMSDAPGFGTTDPDGQVWNCPGLYVIDGASLCSSVGSNPSATIAAIAERNVVAFIRKHVHASWPDHPATQGAAEYRIQKERAELWRRNARAAGWQLDPPAPPPEPKEYRSKPFGIAFDERMQGFHSSLRDDPGVLLRALADCDDESYRRLETRGRPNSRVEVALTVRTENLDRFLEDKNHSMNVRGKIHIVLPGEQALSSFEVQGFLKLFTERDKAVALPDEQAAAVQRQISGSYATRLRSDAAASNERRMVYELAFKDLQQRPWTLHGYKRIKEDPGFDAWRDTTALFVCLKCEGEVRSAGVVHVDMPGFVKQLQSMRVISDESAAAVDADPARVAWTLGTFAAFFFGSLQRIYLPQAGVALGALFRPPDRGGAV
jgi:choline dehydrogenase-like flavoprotein